MLGKKLQIYTLAATTFISIVVFSVGIPYTFEIFFIGLSLYAVQEYNYILLQGLRLSSTEILELMNSAWLMRGRKPHKPSYTYSLMQHNAINRTVYTLLLICVVTAALMIPVKGLAYALLFGLFLFIVNLVLLSILEHKSSKHVKLKMAEVDALFISGVYYIETYDE